MGVGRLRYGSRHRYLDGRILVVAVLIAYLGSVALGGRAQWNRLRVPAETPTFVDMRSITTSWECERRGIDPVPRNPCDPWAVSRHNPRPASRPRLWLLPGRLGLGESATLPLALANAFAFFAAVLWFVGPLELWEALVVAAVLCSPAVMLGVERGNVDLVSIATLAAALVLLRRRGAPSRLVAHGLFLLAAAMKIFPSFAFVVLARQTRRWLYAAAAVGSLFALYIALTFHDLWTIRRVYPHDLRLTYGAGVFADSITTWLNIHTGWPGGRTDEIGALLSKGIVVAGLAAAIPLGVRWRRRYATPSQTARFDGFVAGAAMYLGTYVLLHEYDYRLACLVLVLPQLLWASRRLHASMSARFGLVNVLLVLLLAARSPGWPPFEEVFNWLLFVYFAASLLALAGARLPAHWAALRSAVRVRTASQDESSLARPARR
jgi:drug/metabolite transporter superfamily protein YnfA